MSIMKTRSFRRSLVTYPVILLYLCLPAIFAQNWRNPQGNRRHQNPHRTDFIELCDTPERLEGECHELSECWVADYKNYPRKSCGFDGYRETFCCPDWTEESVQIVSSYGTQHPSSHQVQVADPTIAPARSLLDLVGPIISTFLNLNNDGNEQTSQQGNRNPPPVVPVTKAPVRVPEPVFTRLPIWNPTDTPARMVVTTKKSNRVPTRKPATPQSFDRNRSSTVPTRKPVIPQFITTKKSTKSQLTRTTASGIIMPSPSPNFEGCGRKYSKHRPLFDARKIQTYVIGGHDAKEHWPWMVSRGRSRYSVLVGTSNITTNPKGPAAFSSGDFIDVLNIRIHEQYVPKIHYYDIALLTLESKAPLSELVFPICLPTSEDMKAVTSYANVTLTGWGHTTYGGSESKILQEVELQIIPLSRCQRSFEEFKTQALSQGITTDMLCAGVPQGGVDACQVRNKFIFGLNHFYDLCSNDGHSVILGDYL
ncbi:Clotting factor B [Araneus ventricosus]|uniref:Clotting factor B n=1 Tax=Araneus ventricosus TaxID=182803 RepID=A0A4Y2PNS9_ARAVE|nr:Clotting factor B [Araneus ventricosus]